MSKINSFRDLDVYQKLFALHLDIHEISLTFPKFELYELGSQIRRSSNSAPANTAEGWNNQHTNIYLEALNRAIGECQETQHHLSVSLSKKYITGDQFTDMDDRYQECIKMLHGLRKSLRYKRKN